jgi:hypothetical protein
LTEYVYVICRPTMRAAEVAGRRIAREHGYLRNWPGICAGMTQVGPNWDTLVCK